MTKGGVGPRRSVRLRMKAAKMPAMVPTEYMANITRPRSQGDLQPAETEREVWHEGADKERIDRQPGAAAHERGDEDGDEPIAAVFDHAGSHNAGDGAGERREEGNKRFAGEADAGHQLVHEVGRAGHVAAVFEDGDEKEEGEDLREKDEHAADSGDDAVGEHRPHQSFGDETRHQAAEQAVEPFDGRGGGTGDKEDGLKHHEHDRKEDERAENAVREPAVNAVARRKRAMGGAGDDPFENFRGPAVAGDRFDGGDGEAGRRRGGARAD